MHTVVDSKASPYCCVVSTVEQKSKCASVVFKTRIELSRNVKHSGTRCRKRAGFELMNEYGRTLHAVQIAEFDRAGNGETVRLPIEGRVELQKFAQHLRHKI